MDKVIRDGKVAVLVSPGFGAGWSTWASGNAREWCLFSPDVVAWVEAGKPGGEKALAEIAKAKFGDAHMYCGGGEDLEIEWLTQGTAFEVSEYDGNESLREIGGVSWDIA